ncbi:nuclear transport factor 2 family protein [Pseudonocardia sp. CA-107938]|uniref:nuclear transport factor 2 family protein n=1 Tax=Pseudonocardia sp. CA-107938 TaxID=3240021 RepID=UPI003D8EEFEE
MSDDQPPPGPREVLELFRAASLAHSVEGMARVYAEDAVHDFPFTVPGVPSRVSGRDAIVAFIAANWERSPLRVERYRTVSLLETTDPNTIVVEQEASGTTRAGRPFTAPNLVILTVRDGRIRRFRDYLNLAAPPGD